MSDRSVSYEELARHDGQDGRPAYVAIDGRVYDVSSSRMWKGGTHVKRHQAGRDLTAELSAAPHGQEVLQRQGIEPVGTLAGEPVVARGPAWLRTLLDRFPMLHRHPHPMTVHFPMAYPIAASLFTVLALLGRTPYLFERIAFAMLVLGLVSTPVGIATGFFTWWLNYHGRLVHHVKCKIVCAHLLLAVQLACVLIRLHDTRLGGTTSLVYSGMMLLLLPIALLLGYHGGQLTFPYARAPRRTA